MAHLKTTVVEVKSSENCRAHAIIIAIAKLENDPEYVAYRRGYNIRPVVQVLLDKTGISMSEGGGISELIKYQEYFRQYKITVYQGQACKDIIFEGQVDSPNKINVLYDDVEQHYHLIVNIPGAMAKSTYVMHVKNRARVMPPSAVIRRVAIVW